MVDDVRCPQCNDLIPTRLHLKNCARCDAPLPVYWIEEKKLPFYSDPPMAFMIAVGTMVVILFVLIEMLQYTGLGGAPGGSVCGSVFAVVFLSIGIGIYKVLVSYGDE